MKIKHLLAGFGILGLGFLIGCGGGTAGLTNVNSNQVYTTAGYTIDEHKAAIQNSAPATNSTAPGTPSTK